MDPFIQAIRQVKTSIELVYSSKTIRKIEYDYKILKVGTYHPHGRLGIEECVWPRITFTHQDKSRTIAFTDYKSGTLNDSGVTQAIWSLVGRGVANGTQVEVLQRKKRHIERKVRFAIEKLGEKSKIRKSFDRNMRKLRRLELEVQLRHLIENFDDVITKSSWNGALERARKSMIVKAVHES